MNLLEALGLRRKPTRREPVRDNFTDALHSIGDALDELAGDTRQGAANAQKRVKKSTRQARKRAVKVAERVGEAAEAAREQASDVADRAGETLGAARAQASDAADALRDRAADSRDRVADSAAHLGEDANAKMAAALAALGALTANWDDILKSVTDEVAERVPTPEAKPKPKARKKRKRGRRYPGFWIWLLRLGLGVWFVQRLRGRDLAAYIDHGAGEQMRAQSQAHPVASYKELLDTLFIPNASLFATLTIGAEALAALGFLTGLNRRGAALLGLLVTGNQLLAEYTDEEARGQNLVPLLAQLLLLRTGG